MTIWIASYPRSGNTFLRMLIKQVFGMNTASIYRDDLQFLASRPELSDRIGHTEREEIENSENLSFTKTHDIPSNSDPAIYIIRDGRAAIVSYFHFLRDIQKQTPTLENVITGMVWPGGWSDHVKAWDPRKRDRTLLIKYEDMVDNTVSVVEKLSLFLGRHPLCTPSINFPELHDLNPTFFREGGNGAAFDEITPYLSLFNLYHRDTMDEFGYAYDEENSTSGPYRYPEAAFEPRHTYSPFGDDFSIAHLLKLDRVGRYIDIESQHPVCLSNTALFHIEQGWSGLNVNSNPNIVEIFKVYRPRDHNIYGVIGPGIDTCGTPGVGKAAASSRLQVIVESYLAPGESFDLLNIPSRRAIFPALLTLDWSLHSPKVVALAVSESILPDQNQFLAYQFLEAQDYELRVLGVRTAVFVKRSSRLHQIFS